MGFNAEALAGGEGGVFGGFGVAAVDDDVAAGAGATAWSMIGSCCCSVSCNADLVVKARDPMEAIRLRATRLVVIRRGKVIGRSPAAVATIF